MSLVVACSKDPDPDVARALAQRNAQEAWASGGFWARFCRVVEHTSQALRKMGSSRQRNEQVEVTPVGRESRALLRMRRTAAHTSGLRLSGKTCIVTAAAQGIGREACLLFAREGAVVVATDINATALDSLAKENPRIRTEILDVTDAKAIADFCSRQKHCDVLFNNAGYVHHGNILSTNEKDWDFSFKINCKGMFLLTKGLLPLMVKQGNGSIINTSSAASSITTAKNRFVYGTTKAAVVGFTKSVAMDFIDKGIRCNCICPGTIQTPSLDQRIAAQGKNLPGGVEEARRNFIARQPMGRVGAVSEVAALALYLASDESGFTTGQAHVIDGGWSM